MKNWKKTCILYFIGERYRYCSYQDLAFTANYGFYKPREKTYSQQVKIHLRNELVRIAIFAWIFTCYWNGVNSNEISLCSTSVYVGTKCRIAIFFKDQRARAQ